MRIRRREDGRSIEALSGIGNIDPDFKVSGIVTDFKAFMIDSPTVIIPRGRYDRHRLTWEEAEECGRPSPSEFEMVAGKGHQNVIRHAVAEITISIFAYALHSI
ncbi:hypothetical protein HYALB_00002012 [Hymenoscyphus albidus]|uniref:Uncharacterized protein n=1 Tax=Hymenoscyphus albidus TaxID=595503 RepID=A0A9N9PX75_9HELO|nr:hypothetical protein HYALB_00002012 [Hymenoscyphus albidus]